MSAPAAGAGLPVFWAPLEGAEVDSVVGLTAEEARHAAVRRVRAGDEVLLTDGAGSAARCVVTAAERSQLSARVVVRLSEEPPRPRLTVAQAIPKGERADLAVEALTEVGADRVVAWQASRCVAVWRGDRAQKSLARWRVTAREAAKQARRLRWPEVKGPASLEDLVALVRESTLAVVLHESARLPLAELPVPLDGSLLVVVGPEGGISEEELTALAGAGAHVVRLGPTVLRTSTAGVAAASVLLAQTPRWT